MPRRGHLGRPVSGCYLDQVRGSSHTLRQAWYQAPVKGVLPYPAFQIADGLRRQAARVTGVSDGGLLSMDLRGSLKEHSGSVSFTAEPLEGIEVIRAAPIVRFLGAWRIHNRLQVGEPFGGTFKDIYPIPSADELIHPLLVTWVNALEKIQEHVPETILLPDLDTVTHRDIREAVDAAAMMGGQTLVSKWTEMELSDLTDHVDEGPVQLETHEPLQIRVGTQTLDLGSQCRTLLSANITTDGKSARAVPLDNDTVHRTYASAGSPDAPGVVRGRKPTEPDDVTQG